MAATGIDVEALFDGLSASFRPYVEHSEAADAINFYFRPDADYSERLTEHVTLYRSLEDKSLVGCRIKGISGLVKDAHNWLQVSHDGIQLRVIFWSFRGEADQRNRTALEELMEKAGDMRFEPLPCAD